MNRLLRFYNAAESRSPTGPSWSFLPELGEFWRHTEQCRRAHGIILDPKQHAKVGVANAHRFFQHRLEYWGQLARRRANDLEHVGGRGLLLQGFTQFVEQPRVLDSDDRLIGEGLGEFDLLIGERFKYRSGEHKRADRSTISQQRDAE